ncbi:nucleotidyl transferase AbiEii/AbiGii toxin family protein [Microbispora rosea]|uniref:nucleotidyl transferase AbiEii/AbiGii toxin family protein n=1 Tax=Microbispora rosea TaxID=58117 RepID=UPI003413BF7F
MDDFHRRLATIALRVAADHGFALAGGYAVQAHGVLERPSEDIDLFTSSVRDDFSGGVGKICDAYIKHGLAIKVDVDSPQFVRLSVSEPATGRISKVDWPLISARIHRSPWRSAQSSISTMSQGARWKPFSPELKSATSSMSTHS